MKRLPRKWKRKARTALSTTVPEHYAAMSEELTERLWEDLTDDLRRLRQIVGH